jgi:deoxyuridine 5'-triphosphate nucleotidohydrolase
VGVLIKRVDPDVPLPEYAHPGDAGADLRTTESRVLEPGERAVLPTGVCIALPEGYAAFVHPRSGLAARCGVALVNAPGTVDAGYRGEIKVIVVNLDPRESVRFERFDRIAQLVVQQVEKVRFQEVAELPDSARAEGASGPPAGMPPWAAQRVGIDTLRSYPTGKDSDVFGRRKKGSAAEDAAGEAEQVVDSVDTEADDAERERVKLEPEPRPDGPWDSTEVRDPAEGRVDLGGLFVPGVDGMELRVEVAGDAIVAATVVLKDSAVQLQAFAAPKREGIWGEVREEIATGITQQGGVIDEVEGPLGWELRAQVPVQLPDGTGGFQVVRFVGVDGPRWFLRGVISGQGAVQPQAAGLLEQIFRDTVVVRGEGPMAPRDPIVLKLPDDAQMVAEGVQQEEQAGSRFSGGMGQLQRGPEITEVR